jgi:ubiquinone/menaquinone biosynthesis C-methylase UbiE
MEPGMRVLDVGCGTGDVLFLAARLVGPTGAVLGVDRSAAAVAVASRAVASSTWASARLP